MFSEFLTRVPPDSLPLRPEAAGFPPAGDPAWDDLPAGIRQEIDALIARCGALPWPPRPATGFLAFSRDGSRQADEQPYFLRRRKVCASLLACCTGAGQPEPLADEVWSVCEETSWVISAHNINPVPGAPEPAEFPLPDPDRPVLDLFATQTGMILAFTASLAGQQLDAVSPMIRQRIGREIRLRVLRPFLDREDFWWMGVVRQDLNNWTPWITANVLYCACLQPLPREELLRVLEKAMRILDRYLDVLPADGGCDEGPGYWNMAGGSLADCLEILEGVTGGALSFWQEEKIRNILAFPRHAALGRGWFANFADCDARPFLSGERMQFAGEKTGDSALAALGQAMRGSVADQIGDTPHLNRLLQMLFHPAGDPAPLPPPEDTWLPNLQWRILRRGRWTLCCKGGHNGENHNHNDVGSFMLYADGEPVIADAGNMTYTAVTFSPQRYTLWNVRSAYHNVPMIGGFEQAAGSAHAAEEVACLPDGLSLEMRRAYPEEAGILRCRRCFRLEADGLRVEDEILLQEPAPVTWVLMFRPMPRIWGRDVTAGPAAFTLPEGFTAEAEELPVTDDRMARSYPGSLWRVTVTAPPEAHHAWTLVLHDAGPKCTSKGEIPS